MLELPEARTLADDLARAFTGRVIVTAAVNASPHKFAWFAGDPADYPALLAGRTVAGAASCGGYADLLLGGARLSLFDGVNARCLVPGEKPPKKHQLLLGFDDGSALACSVQMYGGLFLRRGDGDEDAYYRAAREKPSPLGSAFSEAYFDTLFRCADIGKLSAKAFLATQQRIPGLGNGVLQDILWTAGIHPRRRVAALDSGARGRLFAAVRSVLDDMTARGGRDTERRLSGLPGGYRTILSRATAGGPCPACGSTIVRESYLGGSVYTCPHCQPAG